LGESASGKMMRLENKAGLPTVVKIAFALHVTRFPRWRITNAYLCRGYLATPLFRRPINKPTLNSADDFLN